jgi:hypothetical protein
VKLARTLVLAAALGACPSTRYDDVKPDDSGGETGFEWACVIPAGETPDYASQLGCWEDFEVLASPPLDASIPGARSIKTVIDRMDTNALYFQDSEKYPIHWDFAFANLSGHGLPIVPDLGTFNATEYTSPDRRFILGAVTWYEEPGVFVYEIAPYDTASAEMISTAFYLIRDNLWVGSELAFHPTSNLVEATAADLPVDIPIVTTDELFAGVTYQPLNLGSAMGLLRFHTVEELESRNVDFREIVVLDAVPNDITIVSGIITAEFQTPLSHINVLSQNRGTPNMALRGAMENATLRGLEEQWVELTVEAMEWSIRAVTQDEADAWWEAHRPAPLDVEPMDLSVTGLTDIEDVLDYPGRSLGEALRVAIPAFGGKVSHYSALTFIGDAVPIKDAFAIPVAFYDQFMTENGFWDQIRALMDDKTFQADIDERERVLTAFQAEMLAAPVNPDVLAALEAKIGEVFGTSRVRFRSSTNAEDVSGFNGAGLYTSCSADPADEDRPVEDCLRRVWASAWNLRAYDERAYYSIRHEDIGMAVLVSLSFRNEEANGVAITANVYDTTGLEPAFYVNVQEGEASVVQPDEGVTTDQFIYYWYYGGQPQVFLAHSSLVPAGSTVLTTAEAYKLGAALDAMHRFFYPVYGGDGFYGMDVEFKFDDLGSGEAPGLWVKQARPYPGWGG